MQAKSHSGMQKKVMLLEFTKYIVTQGTQVIVIGDDEEISLEELILNVSIIDVIDNEHMEGPYMLYRGHRYF